MQLVPRSQSTVPTLIYKLNSAPAVEHNGSLETEDPLECVVLVETPSQPLRHSTMMRDPRIVFTYLSTLFAVEK